MYNSTDSFDEEPSPLARIFVGFASLLLLPISILNFVALPVGAVWLCVLGHWKLVVLSVLAAFICPKVIGLVTLPSHALQVAAAKLIGRGGVRRSYDRSRAFCFWQGVIITSPLYLVHGA